MYCTPYWNCASGYVCFLSNIILFGDLQDVYLGQTNQLLRLRSPASVFNTTAPFLLLWVVKIVKTTGLKFLRPSTFFMTEDFANFWWLNAYEV